MSCYPFANILIAFSLGNGPPKTTFDVEKGIGRLVLDEGKSKYVSNPFWGKILEEVILREKLVEHKLTYPTPGATDSWHDR